MAPVSSRLTAEKSKLREAREICELILVISELHCFVELQMQRNLLVFGLLIRSSDHHSLTFGLKKFRMVFFQKMENWFQNLWKVQVSPKVAALNARDLAVERWFCEKSINPSGG